MKAVEGVFGHRVPEIVSPSVLNLVDAARGALERAVAALAARSPVPVQIAAMPEERLPPPVEAAADYRVVARRISSTAAKFTASKSVMPVISRPSALR